MLTTEQRIRMLEMPIEPFDLVMDTDAYNEIDDQYAIAYAFKAKEKATLTALYAAPFFNPLSTSPGDGMEQSYHEILKLLKLAGEEIPVYRGSTSYLPDEKTPVISDAAQNLAERAMTYSSDRPLYVAAIGAITNVASALLIKPEIADRMVVVWMGGHALEWPDNYEFNCQQDVAAARVVFGSGVPLVMIPGMGVTSALTTTKPELEYWLKGKNALCDYLVEHTIESSEKYAKGKVWSRPVWDVASIGWLMSGGRDTKFVLDKLIHTPIPEYDHFYAHDMRRAMCKYCYYVNRDALFADLFEKLTK